MQLLKSFSLSALAFAAAVSASIQFLTVPSSVVAGQKYTITWSSTGSGPVTLTLREGDPNNLQTVGVLTSSASGGSYDWTPATSLKDATDYALQITQGTDNNYSGLISLTGGGAAASSAASSASSVASSASSAASSAHSAASSAASSASSVISSAHSAASSASNSTVSSARITSSASSAATTAHVTQTSTTASTSPSAIPSGNGAVGVSSPIALVLGAVAALAMLH